MCTCVTDNIANASFDFWGQILTEATQWGAGRANCTKFEDIEQSSKLKVIV